MQKNPLIMQRVFWVFMVLYRTFSLLKNPWKTIFFKSVDWKWFYVAPKRVLLWLHTRTVIMNDCRTFFGSKNPLSIDRVHCVLMVLYWTFYFHKEPLKIHLFQECRLKSVLLLLRNRIVTIAEPFFRCKELLNHLKASLSVHGSI